MNAEEARNIASNFNTIKQWVSFAEDRIKEAAEAGCFKREFALSNSSVKAGPETTKLVIQHLKSNGFNVVHHEEVSVPYLTVSWS